MELIVMLHFAIFDGWNHGLFEEIDSYRRSHKVYAFEGPSLPPQPIDDMAVQDRSSRMTDKMQAYFGKIGKERRLLAGPVELHSSTLGRIGNRVRTLLHFAPDCGPRCGQQFFKLVMPPILDAVEEPAGRTRLALHDIFKTPLE